MPTQSSLGRRKKIRRVASSLVERFTDNEEVHGSIPWPPTMLHVEETFFTSVGCMDGRVQCPVKHFGQDYFHAKYADTITEAGLVGIISKESADSFLLDSIKKKILISLEKHYSKGIIVHGHEDCAGNPVDDELHREHVRLAVGVIRDMIKEKVPVHGVFAKRAKGRSRDWEVEQLDS